MKNKLHIGHIQVPYSIEWSDNRETIGISLNPDRELTVTAPPSATLDEARDVLDQRKPWILEKLKEIDDREEPPKHREYLSGEKFLYRGRRYRLKVLKGPPENLSFTGSKFQLQLHEIETDSYREDRGAELFREWYWKKAKQELPRRVNKWLEQIDVSLESIEIFDSNRHWGQQQNDTIKLHWCLIRAPVRIQNYVIVHELIHCRTRLHNDRFWNQLGNLMPNYEGIRETLRMKGPVYQM